ncbi:hypothetical protein P43SY_005076 [Pythium insidiosum]|uniref:Dihydroxyacetone kinase n=1 Tax=Pythium insidiosum TaxID=114742 RepID=A0AAD5QAL2_PYTIN|nr:hypothetical protein P43SY_005076 [Pythium insidiosum]
MAKTTPQLVRAGAPRIVEDMLDGLVLAHPHLALVESEKVVLHRDFEAIRERQVTLLSGGGSGHEPAHAGFIGEGMLTGAICGNVFASPSTQQVLAAIRLAAGPKGCLLIVKNYTGDRLNFGLAVEQAKTEGYLVDMVVIGEDVAVVNANAGRRGLSGTVFVHKLAGAAAAQGMDLKSIVNLVTSVTSSESIGTIGVAIHPCTLPGQRAPTRELAENHMEVGLGIHGEPGIETCAQEEPLELAERLVGRLETALALTNGTKVALMINNLGSTTTMELYVVAKFAIEALKRRGVAVERVVVGSFMTALDMSGYSLSVWKLDAQGQHLSLLDAATNAPAWVLVPGDYSSKPQRISPVQNAHAQAARARPSELTAAGAQLEKCIRAACEELIKREPDLTTWDSKVGDGDCGTTLKTAAECILADLEASYPLNDPAATLGALADSVKKSAGGTSGVLYTIFFKAAEVAMESMRDAPAAAAWAASFHAGIAAIQRYGGAREGSRTMLDALLPADRAVGDVATAASRLAEIAQAAEAGADKTSTIPTSKAFGRTGYVGLASGAEIPDPGAKAVAMWIGAIVNAQEEVAVVGMGEQHKRSRPAAALLAALVLALLAGCSGAEPTDGCCAKCIGKPTSKPYTYDPLVYDECKKANGICCFDCNSEKASAPTFENAKFTDGVTPEVKAGEWIQITWSNIARVTFESLQASQVKSMTVRNGSQEAKSEDGVFFVCAKAPGKVLVRGWGSDPCLIATTEFTVNVAEGTTTGTCADRKPTAPSETSSPAPTEPGEMECNLQRATIKLVDGKRQCVCAAEWTGPPDCAGFPWWKIAATVGGGVAALLSIAVSVKAFMNSRQAKKAQEQNEGGDAILGEESITIAGAKSARPSVEVYHAPPASIKTRDDKEYTL